MPLSSRNAFGSKRVRSAVDDESLDTTPSTISPGPAAAAPPPAEPPPAAPLPDPAEPRPAAPPVGPSPSGRPDPPGPDEPASPGSDAPAPPGPFALATRSERSTPVVPRTTSRTCARLFDTEFASFDSPSVDTIDRSLMFA